MAGNFRDGRRHAGLLLGIEAERRGKLPGALAAEDHVVFPANFERQQP